MANPYKNGLEILCAAGVIKPLGKRVLLKAIMGTEGSIIADGVSRDTLKAVCHEVVACGPEVSKCGDGQHVLHISTASDAADFDQFEKRNSKYLFCHEDDIVGAWYPEDAIKAAESLKI